MPHTNPLEESAIGAAKLSKAYEFTSLSHDPMYDALVRANQIVIEFIARNKLLLYGGCAIDYALKLAGAEGIYPASLSATPDLDFYSAESVTDSYKLADILFDAGFTNARAIAAMHIETMKVDCGDKHWVADITYRADNILSTIPTLEWQGMRLVHPHFQRLDIHSALSIPYDNPPLEVIFNRWEKDIKRFNLLDQYYPIPTPQIDAPEMKHVAFIPEFTKVVWSGFNAYSLIYHYCITCGINTDGIVRGGMRSQEILLPAFVNELEFISIKPLSDLEKLGAKGAPNIIITAPYANIIPKTYRAKMDKSEALCARDSSGQLVSYAEIDLFGILFTVVNAQYLLKYFLGLSFVDHKNKDLYLLYYTSLLTLAKRADPSNEALGLSLRAYGSDNESKAKKIADQRILARMKLAKQPVVQTNYYPGRQRTHPIFNPDNIYFFQDDGREIIQDPELP